MTWFEILCVAALVSVVGGILSPLEIIGAKIYDRRQARADARQTEACARGEHRWSDSTVGYMYCPWCSTRGAPTD